MKNILVTGVNGFIGRNFKHFFNENNIGVTTVDRQDTLFELSEKVKRCDVVVHLAGVNRAHSDSCFIDGNINYTKKILSAIASSDKKIPIIYTSSIMANNSFGAYAHSKKECENLIINFGNDQGIPFHIYRLPNVFGKWAEPNYNSVVATFCYNVANGLPIDVFDENKCLDLLYIDDFMYDVETKIHKGTYNNGVQHEFDFVWKIKVKDLAALIKTFPRKRSEFDVGGLSEGLMKRLYATFLTYLPKGEWVTNGSFSDDARGVFCELFKSEKNGQVSFLTIVPGFCRGGHYHNTKVERFFLIHGEVEVEFENVDTKETYCITLSQDRIRFFETVPGWSHTLFNRGKDDVLMVLWANELFDATRPDTYFG